jgi:Domain of unknown function (DUF4118)
MRSKQSVTGYLAAVLGVAAVTPTLKLSGGQINPTTIALALLLIVLFVATLWGSRPALVASVLGMLCFNFFFLPPFHQFIIADPQNWVALAVFFHHRHNGRATLGPRAPPRRRGRGGATRDRTAVRGAARCLRECQPRGGIAAE